MHTSDQIQTAEATYVRIITEEGPEWWRKNRVYGERTGDHMTPVLTYGGLELHSALEALYASKHPCKVVATAESFRPRGRHW